MQDAKRFVQLGADDQLRVLRLMQALADKAGVRFEMLSYDEETGAAAYRFTK